MEREKLISLVSAAQQGDGQAMNNLFNAFYNDVYYFALKTVKDDDLACDITQETFVEIINTIGDLQEPAAFVKWMKQITYHQCTRYFKKKKDVLADEDEEGNTIFDIMAEDRTEFIPDAALDQQDFRKTILAMLDELSEEQRAATLLYYYDELSVKQIAEIQGVSEGTVKSRLNYARKSIKNSVETYEKKNNIKLHSFAFLPFMFWLFKTGAEESTAGAASAASGVAAGVSAATGTTITAAASGAAAAGATGAAAAGTGIFAKLAAMPLMTKIITGVTAVAIAASGVGLAVSNRRNQPTEPTSADVTSGTTNPSGSSASSQTSGTTQSTTSKSTSSTTHVHTYEETVVDPTCTEQGYSVFTCQCGESYQGEFVAAWGHQWYDAEGMVAEEPTEDTPGQRLYSCAICNYVYVEEIPPLGHEHNYATEVTEPTCTQQGYTTYTCPCGDSYVDDYTAALDHAYVSEVIAPTTESQGYTQYECTRCGRSYQDDFVAKLPSEPTYVGSVVPDGCEYIIANSEEESLKPGATMPEVPAAGDQLLTLYYAYTCIEDSLSGQTGWKVCVRDDSGETYPQLLPSINGLPLLSMNKTFFGCHSLQEAPIIPVTVINMHYAFGNCKALQEAPSIPDSVTDLSSAFRGCEKLVTVSYIGSGVTNMDHAFTGCKELIEPPEIPGNVTDLSGAFMGCIKLVRMPIIPDGVKNMNSTFNGCTCLTKVTTIPSTVASMANTFDGCVSLKTTPEIREGIDALDSTFLGCIFLEIITNLPSTLTSMNSTFSGCTALKEPPNIPDGVKYMIGTFSGCIGLETAPDLHEGITNLKTAFEGCIALEEAPIIPNTVTNMHGTFMGCIKLTTPPVIPEGVRAMGNTFRGCTALESAPVIPASVTNMQYTFVDCVNLTGVVEINATLTIYDDCFRGTEKPIALTGTCPQLEELAATATDGNVTVAYEP